MNRTGTLIFALTLIAVVAYNAVNITMTNRACKDGVEAASGSQPDPRVVKIVVANCENGEATLAGTGWVLDEGQVATARHVVDFDYWGSDYTSVWIVSGSNAIHSATVNMSADEDLAILEVNDQDASMLPIPLRMAQASVGDKVMVLGHPASGDTRASHITLMGSDPAIAEGKPEVWEGRIVKGFSGGPVINDEGAVVGLVYAQILDNTYALSIKPTTIISFARSVKDHHNDQAA